MSTHEELTESRAREIGQRQVLLREVNERIREISERFEVDRRVPIVCECANEGCQERIELLRAEYAQLRRVPTHFAVLRGHDIPATERVVEEHDRYVIVEKFGEGGRTAIEQDPARRHG